LPVSAIVLCGGGGRRFAGRDKPLEPLAGEPLVSRVLARLAGQASSIVISANRSLSEYRQFGYPVVQDQMPDCGPLAGLQAGLSVGDEQWIFVCPGDAPLLPDDLIQRLRSGLAAGVDVVIPHDGERRQHLFMLLERKVARGVTSYLAQGGRSVGEWLSGLAVAEVSVPDPKAFTNVNTPDELALAAGLV
jgi:molybdopterin-guanine dinucleotide biosynthesis protein A